MKRAIHYMNIILFMSLLLLFGNVYAIYAQCSPDVTPPDLECKTVNVDLDASGYASVTAMDLVSKLKDDCCADNLLTVSASQTQFSCSDLGTGQNGSETLGQVPVIVTATDCNGNTATCTTTVNVHYRYDLYLQCLGSLTVDLDQNCQATITSDMLDLDASAGVCFPHVGNLTYTISPSTLTGVGTFNVVVTGEDWRHRRASCTTSVTTRDVTPPVISCPSNITLTADASCSAVATWTATATDNCGTATVVSSPASGSTFSVGTTTVTCTATDAAGLTSTCSFTVTVNDVTPPSITCPGNITASAGADCQAEVTYTVTATDNCPGVTVSSDHPSGSKFPLGTTTVTATATDGGGNTASCSFTVTVNDVTPPTITCPANITASTGLGCDAAVSWDDPTATDNCEIASVVCSPASGSTFALGTTTVNCTATDKSGNTASCSFTVTVNDVTAPTIACPPDITVTDGPNCDAVVRWTDPTATDNCGSATVVSTPASGSTFAVGTTTVNCTATDDAGNTASCSFNIIVTDATAPTITCPADITVQAGPGCQAVVTFSVTATDNCPGVTVVSYPPSGSTFPLGTTTVTSTATDAAGNTASCSFNVNVIDFIPPIITCPANITASAGPGCDAVVTWPDPVATDDCPVNVQCVPPSGSTFPLGVTLVICTATDINFNSSICTFIVNVIDDTPPVVTCPANITVPAGPDCQAVVTWSDPVVTDNCLGVTQACFPPSGSIFPLGTTTVTCTATDAAGNAASCSFTVTVSGGASELSITCPDEIIVNAEEDCEAVAEWIPTVEGGCGNITVVSVPASGSTFSQGSTLVTCTATDENGATASCSFNVTVVDVTPPVITCPADITVNAGPRCKADPRWAAPVVTDNCGVLSVTSDHASGSIFTAGTTKVTYTATDVNGNVSTCSFNVIVNDVTPPTFTFCPGNIVVNTGADATTCGRTVTWNTPTAVDACGGAVTMTSTYSPGAFFPVGTTTVIYTATDASNNKATCSFTVTVNDKTPPKITCPADITVNAGPRCKADPRWATPVVTDNCGVLSVTSNYASGSLFTAGTTKVTYTATDVNGNVSTCSFNIIVKDVTPPTFTFCPGNIEVNTGADATACGRTVTWNTPTAVDACGGAVTLTSTYSPGAFFPVGTTTVIYTATDASNNKATCQFTVKVNDKTPPVITCPANITVPAGPDCNAVVTYTATATDNCGVKSIVYSPASGSTFALGTTTVTATATDNSGNTASCSFTVTVNGTSSLSVSCPEEIIIDADDGCNAVATWIPTVTGDCGNNPNVVSVPPSGSTFNVGTTEVTCTATGENGETASCSFNVTVNDVTEPYFTYCPGNIEVNTGAGATACGKTVTWTTPTAEDACGGPVTLSSNYSSGAFFQVGTTTVTYTAMDASNNTATCSFTVTVKDNTPPVVTCPANMTVNAGANCNAVVTYTATATDNCGIKSLTYSPASGSTFVLGTTMVTVTATDNNNNISTCTFTVTVNDVTPPVFTYVPANIQVSTSTCASTCGKFVTWTTPRATDNCGTVTLASDYKSGDQFPVGTTTVTYTATDASNNKTTRSFTVKVLDKTLPTLNVTLSPASLSPADHGLVTITATVTASDNCCSNNSIVLYSITSNEVDKSSEAGDVASDIQDATYNTADYSFKLRAERLNAGTGRTYTVKYKATDCNGNVGYKTATVTVPYNQPKEPDVTFERMRYENFGIDNIMPNPFNSTTTITFRVPENDNVSLVIYNSTGRKIIELVGSNLSPGIHRVYWDGIDESGRPVASGVYYATLKTGIYVTSVPIGLTK